MKAPAGYVWLHMAWNDDHGCFSGELFSIEIDEEITLETNPFEGVSIKELPDNTASKQDGFEIGGESFHFAENHRWLGSVVWDGILLKEEDAHRLMTLAPKVGFSVFEFRNDSPYHKAFTKGEEEHEQARKRNV